MKKLIYTLTHVAFTLFIMSCSADVDGLNESMMDDIKKEAEKELKEEESAEKEEEKAEIAFNGVDKGDYTLYGHTDMDAADAAGDVEMLTEHEITGKFTGKVGVKLSGVCKKAGCWVTIPGREGEGDIRVVFKDHFTIPTDTPVGTEAILLGSMVNDTISVAMQKHYLDDAKEAGEEVAQEEYDKITEDKIEFIFDCESILVKK